jgi:hypothetical protein
MTNTLSPELKKQIEQEAKDLYHGPKMRTWPGRGGNHLMQMYVEGATQYALKLEQAEQLIEQMAKALEGALNTVDQQWVQIVTDAITDYNNYKNGKDGKGENQES